MKTTRRALLAIVVLLVAGAAALVATARPQLEDAHDEAEARWVILLPTLDERYARLGTLAQRVADAGASDASVAETTTSGVAAWEDRRDAEVDAQVRAGNELEALARRLDAIVASSERLRTDERVTAARAAFVAAEVPEAARAFNAAVSDYESERDGLLRGAAAAVLGYDEIPVFDTASITAPAA